MKRIETIFKEYEMDYKNFCNDKRIRKYILDTAIKNNANGIGYPMRLSIKFSKNRTFYCIVESSSRIIVVNYVKRIKNEKQNSLVFRAFGTRYLVRKKTIKSFAHLYLGGTQKNTIKDALCYFIRNFYGTAPWEIQTSEDGSDKKIFRIFFKDDLLGYEQGFVWAEPGADYVIINDYNIIDCFN